LMPSAVIGPGRWSGSEGCAARPAATAATAHGPPRSASVTVGVDHPDANAFGDHQQQSPGSGAISAGNRPRRRGAYFPLSGRTWQRAGRLVCFVLGAPACADVARSQVQIAALTHVLATPHAFFVTRVHGPGQAFPDHRAAVAHRFRGGDLSPGRPGVPDREEELGVGVPAGGAMAEVAHKSVLISMVISRPTVAATIRRGSSGSLTSRGPGLVTSVNAHRVVRSATERHAPRARRRSRCGTTV
jgi:hypothetical protein